MPADETPVGNKLAEILFPAPAERSTAGIIRWWESRRLHYNLIVGSAGLVTLGVVAVDWLILTFIPGMTAGGLPPWQPIVVFALGANLGYLFGPATEILINKLMGRKLLPVSPTLFRMGLTFSVGLALFPALILTILTVINLVRFVVFGL
jgi:hypothetical protein